MLDIRRGTATRIKTWVRESEAPTSFFHGSADLPAPNAKSKANTATNQLHFQFLPSFYFYFVTSLQVVYKSNRFCCAVGMFRRVSSRADMSNSANTKAGSWPVVARISPHGLIMVLCPQAWYDEAGFRAGETAATKSCVVLDEGKEGGLVPVLLRVKNVSSLPPSLPPYLPDYQQPEPVATTPNARAPWSD